MSAAQVRTERARMRSRKPGANRSTCASIRPVMSTGEPDGTWQYAHRVCWPAGRAGRVEATPAWTTQAVRSLRLAPGVHLRLAAGHLGEGAAKMDRPGLPARSAVHGTGPLSAQSTLHDPRPVAEPAQRRAVRARQPFPGQRQQLAGGYVEQHGPGRGQLVEGGDPPSGLHLTAQRGQLSHQRIGQPAAASLHHRPAHRVRRHRQEQPEGAGHWRTEREHRVRGHAAQQRTGLLGAEPLGQPGNRRQASQAEPG